MDWLIIETSGVCDPVPVLATIREVEEVCYATHVDSIIAVVDAEAAAAEGGDGCGGCGGGNSHGNAVPYRPYSASATSPSV